MKPIPYQRVIPRDLFNEAKLLKCIGHLVLQIHDRTTPIKMGITESGEPFKVILLGEGSLTISNLPIYINGVKYLFKTTYNSKSSYPLFLQTDDYCDVRVFDEMGKWDQEFLDFISKL